MDKMFMAALAAATALAACSSGGSNSSDVVSRSGNSDAQKVLATNAGNAAQALEDGTTTLRASQRASSQWMRNFTSDTAALSDDSSATIRRNAAGGLDLTVGGQTISFTAADLTPDGYGFRLPDESAGIWAWNGDSMADALDPANGRYSLLFNYYADSGGDTGVNGFALIGTETADTALASLPTATYSGYMHAYGAPAEGFADYSDNVSEVRGDVNLTANFGAGTVAGSVTNMQSQLPDSVDPTFTWTNFDGGLTMAEANISGNGFTGGLSGDAGFNAAVGTLDAGSTYSGTFFGPAAEEVGGGINMTGTAAVGGKPFIGYGNWQAYKN